MNIHMYMNTCKTHIYTHICMYSKRERERQIERDRGRQRGREGEREREGNIAIICVPWGVHIQLGLGIFTSCIGEKVERICFLG